MSLGATNVFRRVFVGLEPETLEQLRTVAQRSSYPPKTVLCREGETERTFYVVVEGRVIITRQQNGEEQLLNMVGPGGYFGEMGLIDDQPRMATVTTLTPTTVLELTKESFDHILEDSPVLAHSLMHNVLKVSRRNDKWLIDELHNKNEDLEKAYIDLKTAQAQLVEQKRLEKELELAAEVQRSLLPKHLPSYPRYKFAAYLEPARLVGGDFYDVMELDGEHVGILIADVADKGFHAALFMAVTRTMFWQAAHLSRSPAQVALAVHQGLFQVTTQDDIFLTAFYGVLHRPSGRLTYVRAAHDRPLLYRPGEEIEALTGDGRFLGILPDLELAEHTIQLQANDRLILFSDGVPDAFNMAEEQYGNERLIQAVERGGHLPAAKLVHHLADDVAYWQQDAPAFDDLTLLVLEVNA
ncbi:MAG TPA: cyclic nucleotide-binding domain-containing protein [Anaerolineae bacterium]|nr:cyclic nucleotide-binding domain-containing protein [Anaerolineae bacterium]